MKSFQLFRFFRQPQRTDKGGQLSIHGILYPWYRQPQTMVHHIIVIEIIGPDSLASVSAPDLALSVRLQGSPGFFPFLLQKPASQHLQCSCLVLKLAAFILTAHRQSGGQIGDADSAVRRVHSLSAVA